MIEEEMKSDSHKKVYHLITTDKYNEALKLIYKLRSDGEDFPESFLYEGLCLYEEKNDLECLMCLREFISAQPLHEKKDYAVFTAATCLINLGLTENAVALLEILSKSYPDREKELAEAKVELLQKLEAKYVGAEIEKLIRG